MQCSNSLPVLFKWIEVVSEGARKEHWVLYGGRNNQLTSQIFFGQIVTPEKFLILIWSVEKPVV